MLRQIEVSSKHTIIILVDGLDLLLGTSHLGFFGK